MFFTASVEYLRGLPQRYKQTSEINKVHFDVFHSECNRISYNSIAISKLIANNHIYLHNNENIITFVS